MTRIDVKALYPDAEEDGEYGRSFNAHDYEPMVRALGQRVLAEGEAGYYQGDSFKLIADGSEPDQRYGLLTFGWGSCSGCDWLESCADYEALQELADHLQDSVLWFSDKEALRKYMQEHDWEGDWHWDHESSHEFRRLVMEFIDSDLT
jgi:hypothetical protein